MKTSDTAFVALALAGMSVGCRGRAEPPPKPEAPTLNVTHWTARTELYMEYPPLVAGQSALFAVHLTRLADFKAVSAGQARVEFASESGGPLASFVGPSPSRP